MQLLHVGIFQLCIVTTAHAWLLSQRMRVQRIGQLLVAQQQPCNKQVLLLPSQNSTLR